jgi:tagatose kinase
MASIWTMGEMLVEIMRPGADMPLHLAGGFRGPYPSGAPAIFIDTVARLGHGAGIIGGVGADDFGRCLLERLRRDGVDCRYVAEHRGSTAVAFVSYRGDGSRQFIFHIDGTPAVMAGPDDYRRDAADAAFFHIMGCSLTASEDFRLAILETARRFREGGARISFDPNIRPELLQGRDLGVIVEPVLAHASVVMPGEPELLLIGGAGTLEGACDNLFESYPVVEVIVLKRGRRGAEVITRSGRIGIEPFRVEEADPTGAGDCFDAAFLCGMLEGKDMARCGRMAAAAGALNAAAFGPMEGKISPEALRSLAGEG